MCAAAAEKVAADRKISANKTPILTYSNNSVSLTQEDNRMKRKLLSLIVLSVLLVSFGTTHAQPDIPSGSKACSSFGLDNNGALVFGTNFDNFLFEGLLFVNKRNVTKTAWGSSTTGEYAIWTSKYGSLTFNLVGYQLPWAGMNEAGLVLSTMALDETDNPAPDERPPLQSPMWMQYQLDNSATIDDVIASDAVIRITEDVDHFLVCDATTACAVIEFLDKKMVVHKDVDLPISALTNSTYEKSVAVLEEDSAPFTDSSLWRFYTVADRVTGFVPADTESVVDYAFETLKMVNQASFTQWSIVFDVENQRAYFRTQSNPEIRYVDFSTFDLSCSSPVKMLNIHEDLSGDVSANFVDYAHDVNFEHTLNFLEEWNPGALPKEQVEQVVNLIES
jgi:choloylglycine hydrolase